MNHYDHSEQKKEVTSSCNGSVLRAQRSSGVISKFFTNIFMNVILSVALAEYFVFTCFLKCSVQEEIHCYHLKGNLLGKTFKEQAKKRSAMPSYLTLSLASLYQSLCVRIRETAISLLKEIPWHKSGWYRL